MSDEQAAPETKGVTVELLATVDLGPEIARERIGIPQRVIFSAGANG